jgi:hypothetical protein
MQKIFKPVTAQFPSYGPSGQQDTDEFNCSLDGLLCMYVFFRNSKTIDRSIEDNQGRTALDLENTNEIREFIMNYQDLPKIKEPEHV